MGGKRGGALALLVLLLTAAGCGSEDPNKDPTTPADTGDPVATKAVQVEAVRAWLDPDGTKKYENTAIVVARNTSDKIATGVAAEVKWPNGFARSQDQSIVIPPGERGVFLLPNFDAPPDLHGQPKASVTVNKVVTPKHEGSPVKVNLSPSAVNKALNDGSCEVTGTASNKFKNERPGRAGLMVGLKDDKIVTAGTIFFEEPGLGAEKKTKFKVSLEPLCKKGDSVDDVVSYVSLTEADLQNP
jgi:hypothetical protein